VLKSRLVEEGNQSVTNCNRLKMTASDGKKSLGPGKRGSKVFFNKLRLNEYNPFRVIADIL
jgi:hypothetical protein